MQAQLLRVASFPLVQENSSLGAGRRQRIPEWHSRRDDERSRRGRWRCREFENKFYEGTGIVYPVLNDISDLAESRHTASILFGIDKKIESEEKALEKFSLKKRYEIADKVINKIR